jgi:hypothetical protein
MLTSWCSEILLDGLLWRDFLQKKVNFLLRSIQPGSGTHQSSYAVGTGNFFPRIMRQERQTNHTPLSNAKELYLQSHKCFHDVMLN